MGLRVGVGCVHISNRCIHLLVMFKELGTRQNDILVSFFTFFGPAIMDGRNVGQSTNKD